MLQTMSSEASVLHAYPGISDVDRRILAILQEDATVPIAEIAARVGLSQTPCWRRMQRLERDGIILRRVAILDAAKVGLPLAAILYVQAPVHNDDWIRQFSETIASMPEVVEAYRLAGETDYSLRIAVADMAAYDRFYARLIAAIPLKSVTSSFILESLKSHAPLPL